MSRTLASLAAAALLAAPLHAQVCLGDDGLSTGPCWAPTTANLPQLPGFQLQGLTVCWIDCSPVADCANVVLGTPVQVACGYYTADLRVLDCAGNPLIGGSVQLDYTRTWEEVTPGASPRKLQVYRFVAKVDVKVVGTTIDPCKTPTCSVNASAFYYGYADWAFDCDSGAIESSLVLFHNCDFFVHGPKSAVPGVFHPNVSFAVVAPSTAANPFVPALVAPPGGAFVAEAVRNTSHAPGAPCIVEDPLSSGSITPFAQGCGCPFAPAPAQLTARRLRGSATCVAPNGLVTNFLSADTMPGFPWIHVMTNSIGTWTTPASYPGEEAVWVDEVPVLYRDSCTAAAGIDRSWGDVYYGASTAQGYDVVTPSLTKNFTDLAANTSWQVGTPAPATFMGVVLRTRNLIYFNVP